MTDPLTRLAAALSGRIERKLGRGRHGTVYLAHDLKHDRKVALKVWTSTVVASAVGLSGRYLCGYPPE